MHCLWQLMTLILSLFDVYVDFCHVEKDPLYVHLYLLK